MTSSVLRVSRQGPVLTLTLNRPQAANALTVELLGALSQALDDAAADTQVRAIVLAAEGRAFCAGQDLSDPAVAPQEGRQPDLGDVIQRHYTPLVQRLRRLPVPTVACVQGVAAGAGMSLALHCDLVLAGQSASFIQAFGKVGLVPDSGSTWLLPRLVGRAQALGLMLLGDRLSAPDAERLGLIWRCVPGEDLARATTELAQRLAALPVQALAATRQAVDAAQAGSLDDALALEAQWQNRLGASADYLEGVQAFTEKRPARFTDR